MLIKKNTNQNLAIVPVTGMVTPNRSGNTNGRNRRRRIRGRDVQSGRGPLVPAGTRITRSIPAMPDENAGAWVKTLLDPAHSREYGCRGLPDENRDPTLVYNGREDMSFGPTTAPPQPYALMGRNPTNNRWEEIKPGSVATFRATGVTVYTSGQFGTIVAFDGTFDAQSSTSSGGSTKYGSLLYQYLSTPFTTSCRTLGMSHTVSNVTSWSSMGGYFSAGHLPISVGPQGQWTVPLDVTEYSTYRADAAVGAYCITRPRSVDRMKLFGGGANASVSIHSNAGSLFTLNQGRLPSWDVAFTRFYPSDATNWLLHLTINQVIESSAAFSEGGADAASYDKLALDYAVALLDKDEFIFPASANDFKTVIRRVWQVTKTFAGPILRSMGLTVAGPWLTGFVNRLLVNTRGYPLGVTRAQWRRDVAGLD